MHNLIGQTFGRLTVMRRAVGGKRVYWSCLCSCGNGTAVQTCKLLNGNTKSCGCLAQEMRGKPRITHGGTRGPRNTWDPRTKMMYAAKARAIKVGIPFNISLEDIVIPERCPVLDIPLVRNTKRCQFNSPSLDRIVPENGYVKGNIQVISHKANTIKNDATIEDLRKILAHLESIRR